jgi:HSP20 family molecular chaperone IbpA
VAFSRGSESRNMRIENSKNTRPIETTETATDLFDDRKVLRILYELPVKVEENIRIDREKNSGILFASDIGRLYKKKITVPYEIKFRKKNLPDGVLELTLETKILISDHLKIIS